MLLIISVMAAGIASGYVLRHRRWTKRLSGPILWTVALLLFLMGLSVGGNRTLISHLGSLGTDALLIAVCCTLGSVLTGALVYRLLFKNRRNG